MSDDLYRWANKDGMIAQMFRKTLGLVPGQKAIVDRKYAALDADAVSSGGQLDLTRRVIRAAGSMVPMTGNTYGITAVCTDTTAHLYWDGTNGSQRIKIGRPDGTYTIVPPGSVAISGLTALTTYNGLPFWTPNNQCTIGWVPGNAGSPAIAMTTTPTQEQLTQQSLFGREPLSNGALTFKTTSGPPASGGIGGGGDPIKPPTGCVILGTEIELLGDSPHSTIHRPCSEWIWIQSNDPMGRSLKCTLDHPLFTSRQGRTEARDVRVGDKILMDWGEADVTEVKPHRQVCTKVEVKMDYGHLFYANGYLSHNWKMNPL